MIPAMNITAWAAVAPWAELRQIEQDLIISRALVELFRDDFLRQELRFRGGTALNKIHFPAPKRYSEDIDLVRTTHGPIKQLLSRIRDVLEPWLGKAEFEQSRVAPKLIFQAEAEDGGAPLRLRLEINTRETQAFDAPHEIAFGVDNPWFSGEAAIPTYSREEMAATKLRALLQLDKGRDLLDLSHALAVFEELNASRVAGLLHLYLASAKLRPFARAGGGAHVRQARRSRLPCRHPTAGLAGGSGALDARGDQRGFRRCVHAVGFADSGQAVGAKRRDGCALRYRARVEPGKSAVAEPENQGSSNFRRSKSSIDDDPPKECATTRAINSLRRQGKFESLQAFWGMSALSWGRSARERLQSSALCSLTKATTSVRPETLFGQFETFLAPTSDRPRTNPCNLFEQGG